MQEQNLFFNILTFDWPKQPVTFYFHEEEQEKFPHTHSLWFPESRYYCEALAEFQQINIFAKSNQKGLYQTVNDF